MSDMRERAQSLLDPSFQALRAIPSLAWVPLLLLWIGIGENSKVTLVAIGANAQLHRHFLNLIFKGSK